MQQSTPWGTGKFVVREGKDILEFDHWDKIPLEFDNLIQFVPEFPSPPHTPEEHAQIESLGDTFRSFMQRERK
jgi:hypothetical protein